MLGILFGVITQIFSALFVGLNVTRTFGGASDGVDISFPVLNPAMGFGTAAKDSETTEVEIEEVG